MARIETVPLKYKGSALPIYGNVAPQFTVAAPVGGVRFEDVRLDDRRSFEIVEMQWEDAPSDVRSIG